MCVSLWPTSWKVCVPRVFPLRLIEDTERVCPCRIPLEHVAISAMGLVIRAAWFYQFQESILDPISPYAQRSAAYGSRIFRDSIIVRTAPIQSPDPEQPRDVQPNISALIPLYQPKASSKFFLRVAVSSPVFEMNLLTASILSSPGL